MEQTQQPQESQFQFPTEEVTLPSKGLLYPEGSPLKSTNTASIPSALVPLIKPNTRIDYVCGSF